MNDTPSQTGSAQIPTSMRDCWNVIGANGDGTCPELQRWVHCRNCPVFTAAGRSLLQRPAPSTYLAEWTEILSKEKEAIVPGSLCLFLFKIGHEWLALEANYFVEVTSVRAVRSVPFRS